MRSHVISAQYYIYCHETDLYTCIWLRRVPASKLLGLRCFESHVQTHSAARSRNPLTSEEGNCNHVARQSSRRDVRVHSGESSASTVATVEQPGISATRRRIILMRHAESEGAGNTVRDHDRPITAFGRHTAQQVRLCTTSTYNNKPIN
jgi:hypothetical protein